MSIKLNDIFSLQNDERNFKFCLTIIRVYKIKSSGSSGVEHYVDIVVVGGSNPLSNTILLTYFLTIYTKLLGEFLIYRKKLIDKKIKESTAAETSGGSL